MFNRGTRSGDVVDPLLTSCFDVRSYSDVPRGQQWLHERPEKIEPIQADDMPTSNTQAIRQWKCERRR
jgi:hypothetical protein